MTNIPSDAPDNPLPVAHPSFREAFRFWLKLGFISFGGPTGQIAIMHAELVEKRRWISESRFLHALNYCMLLPGPEAQQLAIYVGWLLHRTWGGIVAGTLFVIPSAILLWILSYIYVVHGPVPWIASLFYGLKPAVMAIVAHAVIRIGKKALKNEVMWTLAGFAFVAIFFFKTPFPVIMITASLIGLLGGYVWPEKFLVIQPHASTGGESTAVLNDSKRSAEHTRPTIGRALRVGLVCLLLWAGPIVAIRFWRGGSGTLFEEVIFFSKAAMVTFGGAYAVLPYVAQQAVEQYGWLSAAQMLDGLGLAETTPGPLIMVVQFVGFLGAWNHPGDLPPLVAATLGAAITTWVTFVPCFLWIFLGAPHIEQLRDNRQLSSALSAVTAAVVGVVLNLAVWFAMHVVAPRAGVIDWFSIVVGVSAFAGMLKWKWGVIPVVAAGGLLGFIHHTLILRLTS